MQTAVYLLYHSYEVENEEDEDKLLGVFSSKEMAEEAIKEYLQLPGFKDKPEGFIIDRYKMNEEHWTEGYCNAFEDFDD